MATTTLFIEILVIGTIANIWIGLMVFGLVSPAPSTLGIIIDTANKLSVFLLIPFLGLTYVLGWIINFLSENTIEPLFQSRFKKKFFAAANVDYNKVRAVFYQKASESVVEDLRFDRQLLRISRTSTLNFLLIAISLLFFNTSATLVIAIISFLIALVAFWLWTTQYKTSYSKMLNTYEVVRDKTRELKPEKK